MNSTTTRLTAQVGVPMSPELRARIQAVATANKWSIAQATRVLAEEALDARDDERAAAA